MVFALQFGSSLPSAYLAANSILNHEVAATYDNKLESNIVSRYFGRIIMDAHHSGSTSLRPTPSRRKSSNILASLGRQGTLTDKNNNSAKDSRSNSIITSNNGGGPLSAMPSSASTAGRDSISGSAASISTASSSSSSTYLLNNNDNLHPPLPTPSAPSSQNTPSSSSSFGVALDNLRYLLQKRSSTFGYLKRAHEGKVHWFNTILLQREELDAVFENHKMAKRCALPLLFAS
jgi:hypothetical protein